MAKKISKFAIILIRKSKENLKASKVCIESKLYNASISRSFYAVFLMIKAGLTNQKLDNQELKRDKIIQEFHIFLNKRIKNNYLRNITNRDLELLRRFRTKADYDLFLANAKECENLYSIAHKLIKKIKEIFNL